MVNNRARKNDAKQRRAATGESHRQAVNAVRRSQPVRRLVSPGDRPPRDRSGFIDSPIRRGDVLRISSTTDFQHIGSIADLRADDSIRVGIPPTVVHVCFTTEDWLASDQNAGRRPADRDASITFLPHGVTESLRTHSTERDPRIHGGRTHLRTRPDIRELSALAGPLPSPRGTASHQRQTKSAR
ncbi:hypothetical protein OG426_55230 (plasmid) [Streptomyces canus]|uniref:hypothetical protein n=1 Tax=Streptomyces canus TaxID=58343 RepID=UPI002F919D0D|nr:hypothetical protein OG426_55230 [Streptomyces canus]